MPIMIRKLQWFQQKKSRKCIVENVYYDGKLKLKLSIDFTKWTEVYSEFDRYFWTGLKEKIILNVCYVHFYTFTAWN